MMTTMPMPGQSNPLPNPYKPRRKGLFGSQNPAMEGVTATEQPLAPKQKFFSEGGGGQDIVGNMSDFLLQYLGGQPVYAPMAEQKRHAQMLEANRLRDFANQRALIDYKNENRPPKAPTQFEQILDAAGIIGDERTRLLRRKAENESAGVPIAVDVADPDGRVRRQYIRPGDAGGAAPAAPQPGTVEDGYRFKGGNPADKANWEPVSNPASVTAGAPPRPNMMGQDEYQMFVQSMGSEAAAQAWMRRQGITVGNY